MRQLNFSMKLSENPDYLQTNRQTLKSVIQQGSLKWASIMYMPQSNHTAKGADY